MTPAELIQEYKDLHINLQPNQEMEKSACDLYISIFEKLARKHRLDVKHGSSKAMKFIHDDFKVQDKKRLNFREDEQYDDAYLCAQVQEAYRVFWTRVLGLPVAANLVADKRKPLNIAHVEPMRYGGAMTGRFKAGSY